MSFIPVFGSILSSVPIVTISLASGSEGINLSTGVGVLLWIIGIHFLEANLFNPKIIGTAAKIHPVVVVFALLVGEETGGLIGALLGVPIASMVQAVFLFLRRRTPVDAAT
jgi:predicted PurR-regulated permease PerM